MSPPGQAEAVPMARPPAISTGAIGWARAHLFSNVSNSILSLLAIIAIVMVVPGLIQWALFDAVWSAPNSEACKAAGGACWPRRPASKGRSSP